MGRTQRLEQPEEFGKYYLVARLANGRMAEVYKAKSHGVEGFEKVHCLKVFHPALTAQEGFVDVLIEEAKRSVSLSHANIAQVLDLGREDDQGHYYTAVEFIAGLDLARALKLARQFDHPWSMEMSVFTAAEVAKALDYAHRRKDFNFNNLNILHRSLRPENIMLSYDGEVKVTDFGISRAIETLEPIDDDDVLGRYLYAAPERARQQTHTRQSDIFSLGLVLYEMLAGHHPYGTDADTVRQRAMEGTIAPINDHVDIPRPLQQILESMLVVDPAGRAQSAGQLYEELIGYLFGNNLQADNRQLSLTMQELRRREQSIPDPDMTAEVGLEEISRHELENAFQQGGALHTDSDSHEAPSPSSQALPSSQLQQRSRPPSSPGSSPLPGALESLYQSVAAGRGKAVLLSGSLGRGREVLVDRLAEAVDSRPNASSRLIHTADDDRLRPFGVFSDLLLKTLHQTVASASSHRTDALKGLQQWGVTDDARATLADLWEVDEQPDLDPSTRKSHLLQIVWAMLQHLAEDGTFVLVIDRVERLDEPSLSVLRDLIASIGDLSVLLVLGTRSEESVRALFDAGTPKDLEAIHVGGEEPPTPEDLRDLSEVDTQVLSALALSNRPMTAGEISSLLNIDAPRVADAAQSLLDRGALRLPRPGQYHCDVSNWLTWHQNDHRHQLASIASSLARRLVHRQSRHAGDRLTPTLLRLYALTGDRRRLLNLAGPYGDWLQKNSWQHTALAYYEYLGELLGVHGLGLPQIQVRFVAEAAELALEMALFDHCRTLLEPLNALTEATRDHFGFVRAQLLHGHLALQQDDLDDAREHFERSMETARSLKAPELVIRASLAMAAWFERYGDPEAALRHVGTAVNLDTHRIAPRTRARLWQRAAEVWSDRGMVGRAAQPIEHLLSLASHAPYPSVRCRLAIAQGRLASHRGQREAADTYYDQALGLANSHQLTALAIESMRERAGLCVRHERFDEAISWTQQVQSVAQHHGDNYSAQRAQDLQALAHCELGRDADDALLQLRRSLRRATERGVPKDVFRGHDFLARALHACGRPGDAAHHRDHAARLAQTMRMHRGAA